MMNCWALLLSFFCLGTIFITPSANYLGIMLYIDDNELEDATNAVAKAATEVDTDSIALATARAATSGVLSSLIQVMVRAVNQKNASEEYIAQAVAQAASGSEYRKVDIDSLQTYLNQENLTAIENFVIKTIDDRASKISKDYAETFSDISEACASAFLQAYEDFKGDGNATIAVRTSTIPFATALTAALTDMWFFKVSVGKGAAAGDAVALTRVATIAMKNALASAVAKAFASCSIEVFTDALQGFGDAVKNFEMDIVEYMLGSIDYKNAQAQAITVADYALAVYETIAKELLQYVDDTCIHDGIINSNGSASTTNGITDIIVEGEDFVNTAEAKVFAACPSPYTCVGSVAVCCSGFFTEIGQACETRDGSYFYSGQCPQGAVFSKSKKEFSKDSTCICKLY